MNLKRTLKGPWLWIVLGVIAVFVVLQAISDSGGYEQISTDKMVERIGDGSIQEVTFIEGDQDIEAILDNGDKEHAEWLGDQGVQLVNQVQAQVEAGEIESYDVEVPQPSILGTLITTLLPIIIIALIFFFLLTQVQGGGGRIMQFAKSKAKLITKDMPKTTFADVAGADEAVE